MYFTWLGTEFGGEAFLSGTDPVVVFGSVILRDVS